MIFVIVSTILMRISRIHIGLTGQGLDFWKKRALIPMTRSVISLVDEMIGIVLVMVGWAYGWDTMRIRKALGWTIV